MYDIITARTRGLRRPLIDFAQRLVRTPSPSLGESAAAELVATEFRRLGYDRVHRDEAGNVVGVLFGRQHTPTVVLNSHLDTVAADPEAWSRPVHSGAVEDGVLHGLGAADCKGGLAAQVYAGAILKRALLPLRGNLVVAATVAEENGCSVGVRQLLDRTLDELGLGIDFAILGEPTRLGLYYGHDGWVAATVRLQSVDALQVSDAAAAVVRELRRAGVGEVEEMLVQGPRFSQAEGRQTAAITVLKRLRDGEGAGSIVDALEHRSALAAAPTESLALGVSIEQEEQRLYTGSRRVVRRVTNAWSTDPYAPLMLRARQTLDAAGLPVRTGRWRLGRLGMGTAGNQFVGEYGIPTIGYGPGDEEQAHRVDESVRTEDVVTAARGTTIIAHGLVGIPVCGWTADEI